VHCACSACKKKLINSLVTVLIHNNQSFFFCFFGGLEHQPSPHSWAESSPFLLWAGTSAQPARAGLSPALFSAGWNISPAHAAGMSPALWLGQYRPSPAQSILFIYLFFFSPFCFVCFFYYYYLYIFLKVVIFPRIFLRHFD